MTGERHAAPKVRQALVASNVRANGRSPVQDDGELAPHTSWLFLLFASLGGGGVGSFGSGSNLTTA